MFALDLSVSGTYFLINQWYLNWKLAISQLYFIIFDSGLRFWVLGRQNTVKTLLNKISNGKSKKK